MIKLKLQEIDIKINALKYHSQMKDIDRKLVLELISKPKYKVLVSAEALNAGYNLPDLDAAICASGVSTELLTTTLFHLFSFS